MEEKRRGEMGNGGSGNGGSWGSDFSGSTEKVEMG